MDAETKRRLDALEARVRRLEARTVAEASATAPAPAPAPMRPLQWEAVPDGKPAQPPLTLPPLRPAATRTGRPANWLALAGILVLGLGVVFFLKLAYDRGWVPLAGRYALGVAGGLGLWLLGDLLRRRVHTGFAQALVAGGAAIAYITLYIGYASDAYRDRLGLTLPVELGLLGALAALLAGYALWRRFATVGAFAAVLATVLLAPAGDFSTAGVLYAAVLDTALMLAAVWRNWPAVAWSAMAAANVTIAFGLGADVPWGTVLGCLVAVNACAVAAAWRDRGQQTSMMQAAAAVLLAAVETGFALDDAGLARPFGWSFLAFGALGLLLAQLLHRRGLATGIVAAGLLMAWPWLQFDGLRPRLLAWAAIGFVSIALGQLWGAQGTRFGARITGTVAWAVALVQLVAAGADGLFDSRPATMVPLAAAVASGGLLQWGVQRRGGRELAAVSLGSGLASVLAALAFTLDGWVITVSWAVLALLVVVAGLGLRVPELRFASFGLFAFVLVRIFTYDVARLSVVGRVLAFVATGAVLLLAAFLYARNRRAAVPQRVAPTPPRGPPQGPLP